MCDIAAYLVRGGKAELIVQSVDRVASEGEEVCIRDIYGQQYRVTARIQEINMVTQRVLLLENLPGGVHKIRVTTINNQRGASRAGPGP
jgi:predicted RNA-binding protein